MPCLSNHARERAKHLAKQASHSMFPFLFLTAPFRFGGFPPEGDLGAGPYLRGTAAVASVCGERFAWQLPTHVLEREQVERGGQQKERGRDVWCPEVPQKNHIIKLIKTTKRRSTMLHTSTVGIRNYNFDQLYVRLSWSLMDISKTETKGKKTYTYMK